MSIPLRNVNTVYVFRCRATKKNFHRRSVKNTYQRRALISRFLLPGGKNHTTSYASARRRAICDDIVVYDFAYIGENAQMSTGFYKMRRRIYWQDRLLL